MLEGKSFGIVTTAGGAESSYDGHHGATIEDIFVPIYHSFKYLGVKPKKPFFFFFENWKNHPLADYMAYVGA